MTTRFRKTPLLARRVEDREQRARRRGLGERVTATGGDGFTDLFEDERLVPLAHAGGLGHRILFRDTVTSEAESRAIHHPDYGFVFRTWHPDIRIFDAVSQAVASGLGQPARGRDYGTRAA